MATLTVQNIVEAGLAAAYAAAAAGGDVVPNDGNTFLHVKNGSGGSITVTVTPAVTTVQSARHGTLTRANIAVAVPAGGERFIGPFAPEAFNNSSGQAAITYSGVTSVTLAAVRLPALA